jgi:hypothetical protein
MSGFSPPLIGPPMSAPWIPMGTSPPTMRMVGALKGTIAGCHPLPPDFLGAGIELPMAAHDYSTHYRRVELRAGGKPFNFALASPWAPLFPTKGGGPGEAGELSHHSHWQSFHFQSASSSLLRRPVCLVVWGRLKASTCHR